MGITRKMFTFKGLRSSINKLLQNGDGATIMENCRINPYGQLTCRGGHVAQTDFESGSITDVLYFTKQNLLRSEQLDVYKINKAGSVTQFNFEKNYTDIDADIVNQELLEDQSLAFDTSKVSLKNEAGDVFFCGAVDSDSVQHNTMHIGSHLRSSVADYSNPNTVSSIFCKNSFELSNVKIEEKSKNPSSNYYPTLNASTDITGNFYLRFCCYFLDQNTGAITLSDYKEINVPSIGSCLMAKPSGQSFMVAYQCDSFDELFGTVLTNSTAIFKFNSDFFKYFSHVENTTNTDLKSVLGYDTRNNSLFNSVGIAVFASQNKDFGYNLASIVPVNRLFWSVSEECYVFSPNYGHLYIKYANGSYITYSYAKGAPTTLLGFNDMSLYGIGVDSFNKCYEIRTLKMEDVLSLEEPTFAPKPCSIVASSNGVIFYVNEIVRDKFSGSDTHSPKLSWSAPTVGNKWNISANTQIDIGDNSEGPINGVAIADDIIFMIKNASVFVGRYSDGYVDYKKLLTNIGMPFRHRNSVIVHGGMCLFAGHNSIYAIMGEDVFDFGYEVRKTIGPVISDPNNQIWACYNVNNEEIHWYVNAGYQSAPSASAITRIVYDTVNKAWSVDKFGFYPWTNPVQYLNEILFGSAAENLKPFLTSTTKTDNGNTYQWRYKTLFNSFDEPCFDKKCQYIRIIHPENPSTYSLQVGFDSNFSFQYNTVPDVYTTKQINNAKSWYTDVCPNAKNSQFKSLSIDFKGTSGEFIIDGYEIEYSQIQGNLR